MQIGNPDARLAAAKEMVQSYPEALEKQIRECGGLNQREASIWLFHFFKRNMTELNSGSIVDYRKYTAEYLDEEGELTVERKDLSSSHKKAAYSKYREFQQFDSEDLEFSSSTSDEVDIE